MYPDNTEVSSGKIVRSRLFPSLCFEGLHDRQDNATMKHIGQNELLNRITGLPLISKYLGHSLQERITSGDWFENRFIRAILLEKPWMRDYEELFKKARIEDVINSNEILGNLHGCDLDYDMQMFDALVEVRLVGWARENWYTKIEKIANKNNLEAIPDFRMLKNGSVTIAEAKHFRERDYLLDFVYDRIAGLFLITDLFRQFGLKIETTPQYEKMRDVLTKEMAAQRQERVQKAREDLPLTFLGALSNNHSSQIQILDGLVNLRRTSRVGLLEVETSGSDDPNKTCELMLSKLEGKLNTSLKQIATYYNNQIDKLQISSALVFFSGTGPESKEWGTMWEVLCNPTGSASWARVGRIYSDAKNLIGIPFELIVGRGNPLEYRTFLWSPKNFNDPAQ